MKAESGKDVTFTLTPQEALVLFELLQRLVEEEEQKILSFLHSSAEFAVLCRINSHLETSLKEPFQENYDELLARARASIIRESGHYIGIEEK